MASSKASEVDINDLLSDTAIPGADENTLESTIRHSGGQSISAPEPLPGEVEALIDETDDDGDPLTDADQAPEIPGQAKVLIHFVEDGFSSLEQIWYTGQELEVPLGSRWWDATLDREGESWMILDEEAQIAKWGKVFFRPGPWPGEPFGDARALDREKKRARRPSHPNPGSLFPSKKS